MSIDFDEPPFIVEERCNSCGLCILECSQKAIVFSKNGNLAGR